MDMITLYTVVSVQFTLARILVPLALMIFEETAEKEGEEEYEDDNKAHHGSLNFCPPGKRGKLGFIVILVTMLLLCFRLAEVADWSLEVGHETTTFITMVYIGQAVRSWQNGLLLLCFLCEGDIDEAKGENDSVRKEKTRGFQEPTHKEQCDFQEDAQTVEPKEEIILCKAHDWRSSEVSSTMTCLPTVIKIHHSAFTEDSQWDLVVKCKDSWDSAQIWKTLAEKFPEAVVRENETSVIIKILSKHISKPTSFVVVGAYGHGSYKRMQLALFGGKAVLGKNWVIKGCLIDDDYSALKVICEEEEKKGNHLLVQPRLLLVSNSGKSIEFDLQSLSKGWKVLHTSLQYMQPEQVWDFWGKAPGQLQQCSWTIHHEDKNKQYLECEVNVKQGEKSTYLPVLEYFKEEEAVGVDKQFSNNDPPPKVTVSHLSLARSTALELESKKCITLQCDKKQKAALHSCGNVTERPEQPVQTLKMIPNKFRASI